MRRASSIETSTSPARSEPMNSWPAQTSRQISWSEKPRGPWLSTMTAAQPCAFSISAQRTRLSLRPVAARVEERGRERPVARRPRHPVVGARASPRARPARAAARSSPGSGRACCARRPARTQARAPRQARQRAARRRRLTRRNAPSAGRSPRASSPAARSPRPRRRYSAAARSSGRGRSAPSRPIAMSSTSCRKVTTGYQRSSGETSGPTGGVHPVRLAPEGARAEEGDRVARVLQVDDPHRPPVRAGDVEVVLLVGEADRSSRRRRSAATPASRGCARR